MALSPVGLCARALVRLGAVAINGFDDGSAEAETASSLYGPVRDALLSVHPWSFATGQRDLSRLAAAPTAGYRYAFAMPPDFLRVLHAGSGHRAAGIDHRIVGGSLHTDANMVVLTYILRPSESDFPPFFDMALIARLTAEFCIPVTENTSRADVFFRLAEEELRRAKLIDAQQDTPPRLTDFPLVSARS